MAFNYYEQTDSYVGAHNFLVTVDGTEYEFSSVSGVVTQSEEVEFMHGIDPFVRRTAGRVSYEPIQMERVYRGVDDLYQWRLKIEQGVIERRQIVVELLNSQGNPVRRMVLEGAWPVRWEMPDFDATSSGPALEKMSFQCDFVREQPL